MKKLVRRLSTRKPDQHQDLTTSNKGSMSSRRSPGLSSSIPSDPDSQSSLHLSTAEIKSPSVSGTQPGFIPFGTTLYFQGCPHSTPPTPRPAYIPPVLLTQVSSPASTSNHSRSRSTSSVVGPPSPHGSRQLDPTSEARTNPGERSASVQIREATVINQFFTSPRQCFDCSLLSARSAQRMVHEAFDAKIRRGRLRIGLACADLASLEIQARQPRLSIGDIDTDIKSETIEQRTNGVRGEIFQAKEIVREWVAKRDEQVQVLWDEMRASWDGAVREVVRDDGSGEGLETCSFRVTVVEIADADQSVGARPRGDEDVEMEGGLRVEVFWESVG